MKKILGLILISFFVVSLFANAHAQTATKKFRIGLSTPASDNPFWTTVRRGAEAKAKEMNVELLVKVADENQVKQLKDVEDFIQMKLDLIMVSAVEREGSQRVFEVCKAAGIPTIAVGRGTISELPIFWTGFDEFKVGFIFSEWTVKRFPNGCKLAWLRGPAGAGSFLDMEKGAMSVWEKNPQVKIVYKQAGRDNRPTGMKLAEDVLQAFPKGQLDVIIGGNDELGLGALSSVEAAGRTEVLVTGQNGTADAIAAVKKGRLALTVAKPSGVLGLSAVEQAVEYLKGKREFVKKQYVDPIPITPENIDKIDTTWTPK
jgi:ribose transport system substrate-binding protein